MSGREIAFGVLRRVEEGGAYASRALDAALATAGALDPREAGLATELVYGTLRRALSLDAALAGCASRPLEALDPAARVALRLGAYELLHLGTAPHAAVSQAVALAKTADHGRAAGFVNAVLRALARRGPPAPPPFETDPAGHLAAAESLPRWIAEEWVAWLGPDQALGLAAAMNRPAPLCLRSARRDALRERLAAAGIEAAPTARSPHGLLVRGASVAALARAAGDLAPRFQVQDEAAQLISLLATAGLPPGARVLDACAAPGGKAFHLAEMVGPGGEVVAVELHPRKADDLRREAERRGLGNVRVICADASRPVPGLAPGSFDAVLVDAPCAGLGTLRRHPELKLRRQPADLPRLAALQVALLAEMAGLARPGAPVTYAVCSLSRAEGPDLVASFTARGWRRVPPPPDLAADLFTAEGDLLTLPSRHGCDGFFAARLLR